MTLEDRLERGRQAQLVLDSKTYQSAVSKITEDIRSLRLAIPPGDVEAAYRLVVMEKAVEKAKRLMEQYLQDADAAKKELEKSELPGPVGRLNRRFRQIIR